jgi:hypothetical protein
LCTVKDNEDIALYVLCIVKDSEDIALYCVLKIMYCNAQFSDWLPLDYLKGTLAISWAFPTNQRTAFSTNHKEGRMIQVDTRG